MYPPVRASRTSASPSQLMRQKSAQVISRKMRLHHHVGKHNLQAEIGNSPSQLVVIREEIDDRTESANALQIAFAKSQRRSKPEVQSAFQLPCHEHAGAKIGADAQ